MIFLRTFSVSLIWISSSICIIYRFVIFIVPQISWMFCSFKRSKKIRYLQWLSESLLLPCLSSVWVIRWVKCFSKCLLWIPYIFILRFMSVWLFFRNPVMLLNSRFLSWNIVMFLFQCFCFHCLHLGIYW